MTTATRPDTRFAWLWLTDRCQLACRHCASDSGPHGTHGSMALADWKRVIDELAAAAVTDVQFYGGEPTSHPDLPQLIEHARSAGLTVEVYSNLFAITPRVWATLQQPGVRLATSYYSADQAEHELVTGRSGSHQRTRANIAAAVRRGIPVRVGIVRMRPEQDVAGAVAELTAIGVPAERIHVDDLRRIGRGGGGAAGGVEELCGHCGDGSVAIRPDGRVQLCAFSGEQLGSIGNVHDQSLAQVLAGAAREQARAVLAGMPSKGPCQPDGGPCIPKGGECLPYSDPCNPRKPKGRG
ncbi:MAG: Radical [Pseudonocardia sp.]|nr:Radical [Pseudonocardia sp.]